MSDTLLLFGVFTLVAMTVIRYWAIPYDQSGGKLYRAICSITIRPNIEKLEILAIFGQSIGVTWIILSYVYQVIKLPPDHLKNLIDLGMTFGPLLIGAIILNIAIKRNA